MPAPVPIQIRYDDAGLLGAAAAASGQGQAWNQQHAMDMQLIMQQIQAKQQAALMQQQSDAHMNELQTAHDFQMRQIQASQPTPENYYQMSGAASDPSTAMKQMGLEAAKAAGVQGPELAMLQTAAGNKNVNAAYFENIKDETIKRAQTTANKNKGVQEKQAYLDSLGNTVPAEAMTYLKSLAGAEDINLPQFTSKIQEMRQGRASQEKQAATEQKAIVQMGIGVFNDKINQAQSELKAMEKDMQDAREKAIAGRTRDYQAIGGQSYDEALAAANAATPAGTSEADFAPRSVAHEIGWGDAARVVGSALIPGLPAPNIPETDMVGGDSMGLQAFLAIKQKRQAIADLQKQRDALIGTMGTAMPTQAKSAQSMSDQELLQALR